MGIEIGNIRNAPAGCCYIYVGRANITWNLSASPLSNPFPITKSMDREASIAEYRRWLWAKIQADDVAVVGELSRIMNLVMLKKNVMLLCWCAPLKCHAEVIKSAVEWWMQQHLS